MPEDSLHHGVTTLKDCLAHEWLLRSINTSITHSERSSNNPILSLIDYVPCILHLENRTGLKIFTIIFREGLSNVISKNIYPDIRSQQIRIEAFLSDVAEVCNEKIWGTEYRPTSWKVPFDNKEKTIEEITLDNNKTREICLKMSLIIQLGAHKTERKQKWIETLEKYVSSMIILRKKEDFSLDDIMLFQYDIDLFFSGYMDLVGRNGITSYFH
jgi:hypothetical protein